MLGTILSVLFTVGLVAVLYTECIYPMIRSWRKRG